MAKLNDTRIYGDLKVDGEIKNKASTTSEGVVKLNNTISSTSTTEAATANAVKTAYDKANHSHPYASTAVATTSANGLMSSTDKKKLDGIAANANNYSHPTTSGNKHIPSGGSAGQILRWSADGTAAWGADNNTTYSVATITSNGLMSSTDKAKLDGIATGANNYSHPTTSGNKHIPSGGSSGQILRWSADGTAAWGAENNTDTKVTNTLATTTKAYITGTTSATTNTGTQVFDTGVYLDTTAGTLTATTFKGALSGNASTATKLQTARTLTIGNTGKPFDGSGNVTWTLSEIGAAAASHSHSYLPLAGGTLTGALSTNSQIKSTVATGTAPFTVTSTTVVSNLNADMVDGKHASDFASSTHTHNYAGSSSAGGAATSAVKLATARTISLTGSVTGSGTFDGSGNLSIATTTNHTHSYLPLSGGRLTGDLNIVNRLFTKSVYHYPNGILITTNITSTQSVMVDMRITGNSYGQNQPIDTKVQLYNYGSYGIINYSAIANGLVFPIYAFRQNNVLCFWMRQPSSYQTFRFDIGTSLKDDVTATISDAAKPTTGITDEVTINPMSTYHTGRKPSLADIGAAASSHTHNYAGSSSAGGAATSAVKLNTARTLKIGSSGKTFDGSADVTWTLSEIGAAASSHSHSYLPLSGGTLTGRLTASGKISIPTTAGSWISGKTLTNASIAITTPQTTSSYHPILAVQTSSGNVVNIGGLGDNVGFYGFKSTRTDNATDWSFTFNSASGAVTSTGNITAPTFSGALSGNASTATKLATARTINGVSFDGTQSITITAAANGGTSTSTNYVNVNNTETKNSGRLQFFQKSNDATINPDTGWWSTVRTQHSGYANGYWQEMAYSFASDTIKFRRNVNGTLSGWKTIAFTDSSISGNAATATKLQTSRTLKIGSTGKTFNGSADVTWTLAEIGAAASSHTHSYLPLSGGTLTGALSTNSQIKSTLASGTAPFTVASTTVVSNLNADMVDGKHASDFASSSHTHNYAGSSSAGGAATSALKCTGNSATATKLATARNISLTGLITGSGKFDGSSDLSIAASFNPIEIKSTDDLNNITNPGFYYYPGGADLANSPNGEEALSLIVCKYGQDGYLQIAVEGGDYSLHYRLKIGSAYNWDTRWTCLLDTMHDINASIINTGVFNIARIPTGTTSTTVALGNHTHSNIIHRDDRSTNILPKDLVSGVSYSIKSNATDSLSDGGTYHGVLSLKQWSDNSGGLFHQLGFTDNGNICHRTGKDSTWNGWNTIYTTLNKPSASTITAGTFSGVMVAQANTRYTTRQLRNTIISTASPSGGANGDVWIKYS